jgi:hypothetical protein
MFVAIACRIADRLGLLFTAVLSVTIFSGMQTVRLPPGGFFLRAEPVSSKLLTHILMACADGMRS